MEWTKAEASQGGSSLDLRETERAIRMVKEFFQTHLAEALNLLRVSAPLFVAADTGINDNLNGTERPVSFPVKAIGDRRAELVPIEITTAQTFNQVFEALGQDPVLLGRVVRREGDGPQVVYP